MNRVNAAQPSPVAGRYPASEAELSARTRALESLLLERGLLGDDTVDRIVDVYQREIGPLRGAAVVARAWVDPDFKELLLHDAPAACAQLGIAGLRGEHLIALENTQSVHHVVVCTLCSCYPWAVLGLPPSWYKSPPYRARVVLEPRRVLSEDFGLQLDPDTDVRVVDSSAEVRYMVVPQRPAGTDGLSEAELAACVTRDSMVGVARARIPEPTA